MLAIIQKKDGTRDILCDVGRVHIILTEHHIFPDFVELNRYVLSVNLKRNETRSYYLDDLDGFWLETEGIQ